MYTGLFLSNDPRTFFNTYTMVSLSSESSSLPDPFLDNTVPHDSSLLLVNDFNLALGNPESFIAAQDQDSPHSDRCSDTSMHELFLTSQPYDQHDVTFKSLPFGDTHRPLPQIITENINNFAVDVSVLVESDLGYETHSTATSSSYGSFSKEEQNPVGPQTLSGPRPRRNRREKARIELAPDQPPTTQGKPRARVYVACVQWYVNSYLVCLPPIDYLAQVVLAKSAAMARSQPATVAVIERLGLVVHVHMTHIPSVVVQTRHLVHVNEPLETQAGIHKLIYLVTGDKDATPLPPGSLIFITHNRATVLCIQVHEPDKPCFVCNILMTFSTPVVHYGTIRVSHSTQLPDFLTESKFSEQHNLFERLPCISTGNPPYRTHHHHRFHRLPFCAFLICYRHLALDSRESRGRS